MDTKKQALEKAHETMAELCKVGINFNFKTLKNHIIVEDMVTLEKYKFWFEEPMVLKQDTLCMCSDGLMRYACGELIDGRNAFYFTGISSKNYNGKTQNVCFAKFEILETPCDFERVQTTDEVCLNSGCKHYPSKHQRIESEKFINGTCERCTILVGTPSRFEEDKK